MCACACVCAGTGKARSRSGSWLLVHVFVDICCSVIVCVSRGSVLSQ